MSYHATKTIPQRFSGLIFVILFHVLVIYGLAAGLGHNPMSMFKQEITAKIIEDTAPPEEEAPPPPPPDFVPPPPDFVPPPDIAFTADVLPTNANAITVSRKPVEVKVLPARSPKKGLSQPPYPSASSRLGEEGVVVLALYLNEQGRVTDGKVATTSGHERLDTAALKHAIRVWKFDPCTKENQPVACWHQMKFRFQLSGKDK